MLPTVQDVTVTQEKYEFAKMKFRLEFTFSVAPCCLLSFQLFERAPASAPASRRPKSLTDPTLNSASCFEVGFDFFIKYTSNFLFPYPSSELKPTIRWNIGRIPWILIYYLAVRRVKDGRTDAPARRHDGKGKTALLCDVMASCSVERCRSRQKGNAGIKGGQAKRR